jgi:hypothetical protein
MVRVKEAISEATRLKVVTKIREEYEFAYNGELPQKQREDEDLRFQVPEFQWDEESANSRRGRKEPNGTIILPRPMLSIDKLGQPCRLVMDQYRKAKLGVNIHPVSRTANQDTARMLQDLYRRWERDSNAPIARGWALDRAVKCGRGVYRVTVRPDEDGFNYGDLEIGIERMLHQGSVVFDPSAQLPDYSDGDIAYVTSWMRLSKAARLYPDTRAAQAHASGGGLAWASMTKDAGPLWTRESTASGKSIQIAECWWKEYQEIVLLILDNGTTVIDGEGEIPRGVKVENELVRPRVTVWKCVTDGFDLLDKPRKWFGKYIPLIPVLGRELQPFSDERYVIGLIRNARDPQRFYNSSVSTLVERMFLEPRAPWVMFEGQDKGREADWAQANYRNIPVLKAAPVIGPDGNVLPLPQRVQVDSSGMSVALLGVQQAGQDVQETTAFFDPSLGKDLKGQESGRHALALQGQGDAANSDWLDNLAVAMYYEALVAIDIVAPAEKDRIGIYDAPGRVTTVVEGANNKTRPVMLNRHYVVDQKTGEPRAVDPETEGAKYYDLKGGARYGISVEVGAGFKTRLQEADESLTRMVEAAPEFMLPIMGDLLLRNKDFEGKDEMADRLERMIRAQHPELFKTDEEGPEQIAQKAKALEAANQQLTQQLQQASQIIETKQVEVQAKKEADIQIETLKQQTKLAEIASNERIARENNAAKLAEARLKTGAMVAVKGAELEEERFSTGLKLAAEADRTAVQADHERRVQIKEHAHDVGMAAAGGNKQERTVEGGQETGAEESRENSQGDSAEQTTGQNTGPAEGATE